MHILHGATSPANDPGNAPESFIIMFVIIHYPVHAKPFFRLPFFAVFEKTSARIK